MITSPLYKNPQPKKLLIDDINNGLYNFVGGIINPPSNIPSLIAWELENEAMRLGWPNKHIMGSEKELIEHFEVSRESLREATKILERRGAMKMLRGRYGGLSLLQPDIQQISASLVGYLQICGYSRKHVFEAALIFDRMLIQWLIKNEVIIQAPSGKTSFRTQLALASGESVFVLYATTLDLISKNNKNNSIKNKKIENLLCVSIKNKDQKESERLSALLPIDIIESTELDIINDKQLISRAIKVSIRIMSYSRAENNSTEENYHSEWELCQALDESRSLIRQGLRILQDADMLESKIGRTGGFILKQPSPAGIIRQVFPILASERRNIKGLSSLIWKLNLAQLELASIALQDFNKADRELIFEPILTQIKETDEPKRWIYLQQKIGEISNNPVLDTILRCIITYLTRLGQVGISYPEEISSSMLKLETLIIKALINADLKTATIHQQAAQSLLMKLKSEIRKNDKFN